MMAGQLAYHAVHGSAAPIMSQSAFHPAVRTWFERTFAAPTPVQSQAWPAIAARRHALIAAPTGSGKTLAAFLSAIDELVREGLERGLPDAVCVLYVSPLRALSNDIRKNLEAPLCGIADALNESGLPSVNIRALVRTGDTTQAERSRMRREPPHILVTTPESLFILLTSDAGRNMLRTVRNVIVDEIHALAGNKRGTHLALSLERLAGLTSAPPLRIGLSATQRPIETVARFLVGNRDEPCSIIDTGTLRRRDLSLELPSSPLEAVLPSEVWEEIYARLTGLIEEHRTTLIFVNTRRLAERAARHLGERLGEQHVTSHHGSLAREHRLHAEERLKRGELKALVCTSSLELGIDIGDVDLVCQLGSPKSIAAFLQRAGRAGHHVGGIPKGRLFPLSRDDLVECAALLEAINRDELDLLRVPTGHLDVLAQQVIAETACRDWTEDDLHRCVTKAWPYRELSRADFDRVMEMLADGFSTRRGRRSRWVQRDAVHGIARGRPGAKLAAVTNAGAIPDLFDYDVVLEPDGHFVGTVNEDFAFESLPGDVFQLGNASYRVRRVEQGRLRVEDAHGQPPNIPFWLGEAPGRTDELSHAVSRLRRGVEERLLHGAAAAQQWLVAEAGVDAAAAGQIVEYLAAAHTALGLLPTREDIVFERFFDETGDQHLVIHAPFGSRLNRAWGLALRKRFCRKFNFELQAAALEDSIVISLGPTHSFALDEVARYLQAATVREVLIQALLAVPMFTTRWRWNASIALAVRRNRNGRRVPAQFQRMDAEDLMAVVFPDQLACQENLAGEREIPTHPLVDQTIADCLHEAMDIDGLERLLSDVDAGMVRVHFRDLPAPSPLAAEILTARPYAFLDDAPAEERRTLAVNTRRFADPAAATDIGRLDPAAIAQVCGEAWPTVSGPEDLHDALLLAGFVRESEAQRWQGGIVSPRADLDELIRQRRATVVTAGGERLWACAERLPQVSAVFGGARLEPAIAAAGPAARTEWTFETALVELLRARLECLGPVGESVLAAQFQCGIGAVRAGLAVLEAEGWCMRGRFTGSEETEWCERALLARIHRYTLQSLRREIRPVAARDYLRFLFSWHGIGTARPTGDAALLSAIDRLEGFGIAAAAWEADILPSRLDGYLPGDLDRLCSAGQIAWLRLRQAGSDPAARAALLRHSPITLMRRQHAAIWMRLCEPALEENAAVPSATAQRVLDLLERLGASFFLDLVQHSGLLRTQVEEALAELAARGLVTSDSFAGLRALIVPAGRRQGFGRQHRRRTAAGAAVDAAGRWSLLHAGPEPADELPPASWMKTPPAVLEHVADVLLRRYGVVFRKVLEREPLLPPWRELLYVLRRLEARGEVRGGRFVEGFSGEQFALPEAIGLLRGGRTAESQDLVVVSAADPLNLTGILLPGERIAATGGHRIVFRDGIPVARQGGRDIEFLGDPDSAQAWQIRNLLSRRRNPAAYLATPPRAV
jgi:ATP-dependent Lhr-like helicase